uniref:MFS domain-containing protein n=1 Tax=Syphacia muris TaxID=451379 RepID=A0A0N5AIT4_9BILA
MDAAKATEPMLQIQTVKDVENNKPKVKTIDDFVELGWYTLFVSLTCELGILAQVYNVMFMVFAGASPKVVGCGDSVSNNTNWCSNLAELRQQTNCTPKLNYQFYSVNIEFDRLCSDSIDVKNSISIQMLGVLLGASVTGQISDAIGRKPTMILCTLAMILFGYLSLLANTLVVFTVWRFIIGLFCGGHTVVLYVYMLEQIPQKHRFWIAGVVNWAPNYFIIAATAYFSYNWRTFTKAICIIEIPAVICLILLQESPRWLMQKGKFSAAKKTIMKMRLGMHNSPETELEVSRMIDSEAEKRSAQKPPKQRYVYHLFSSKKLAIYALTLGYGYFLTSIVNYGLMFNLAAISGSIYWNLAIIGLFRWIINILAGVVDLTLKNAEKEWHLFLRYSTLAAAAFTSQGYITKNVVVVELFPTAIRNIANSFMGVTSRVGSMFAPQLFNLASIWFLLPYVALLTMTMIELTAFQVFIPETKFAKMTDHIESKKKTSN